MHEETALHRPAAAPAGDLACDFTIARDLARRGFRERLAAGIVGPIRQIDDGVAVTFTAGSWDLVREYIETESRCCPFLDLAARRDGPYVVLTVTGRAEAREFIANIFTAPDGVNRGIQH